MSRAFPSAQLSSLRFLFVCVELKLGPTQTPPHFHQSEATVQKRSQLPQFVNPASLQGNQSNGVRARWSYLFELGASVLR
ncbi:MAG: hypothetical protein JWM16_1469 [Verrucomicrobiales bacterium]|nr:hypothetical protein [Verrucomicrobiales bacterium]